MTYKLVIKEEAFLEIREAYQYYEFLKPGLGEDFLTKLEQRFNHLSLHPELYSYIDSSQILRDVALDKFPFVIVFEIDQIEVIVYAIHLTHKKPHKIKT